ncbi:hypothetical protein LshimejAT787_0106780 [Lyophyllum shimeji]|uniref:Uncharacterized protein n=1 Tax=Lyophyllum shimeji TaxID=47721 RepID=A0A9P3PE29_LYOSH|nr:hypothetical protein LshimejAT787_0106780 [Lyophyllum shimeji]
MTAFSRIQLAAALIEYDNDDENPDAPKRSAYESALFLPLRQNAQGRPLILRKTDYLGVPLPGEGGGSTARSVTSDSALGHRQSRASISTLQNPFPADDHLEEEGGGEEGELEVDLASWGLDAFMPKDKSSKNNKGKEKSTDLVSPHAVSSVPSHQPLTSHDTAVTAPRRALGASRSMSVGGNLEYFGTEKGEGSSSIRLDDGRRRSIASPVDTIGMKQPQLMQRRRAASYSMFPTRVTSPLPPQSVPFPTTPVRSTSPNLNEDTRLRSSSLAGRLEPPAIHERALSSASMDSKLLKDGEQGLDDRQRTMSSGTMATILQADDNPFALRPPSRASRFDPKAAAHARTMSNASMGSRMLLENDGTSMHTAQPPDGREQRYSTTLDLLRPKVLVMPSPLQGTTASSNERIRDGFQSTDGPPLPPGARSSRRISAAFSAMESPPIASNSFTPNALAALSLSQRTFRNTLGGQRDSYMDGPGLPRATAEGEQAQLETELEEVPVVPVSNLEGYSTGRPAGKLYGKSLIDDLENRKAQMRNKQRVFTGDERPSMMARGSLYQRSNTLIDQAALQSRPASQHMPSFGSQGSQQALGRRNSSNIKPLLNFEEDDKPAAKAPGARLPSGRSVFGVDTLWEKEMAKLKEIEAKEKQEEKERRLREEAKEGKKKKKKSKRKEKSKLQTPDPETLAPEETAPPRVSIEPPVLPDIPRANRRPPPPVTDNASESDQSDDDVPAPVQQPESLDPHWHADSSDEDEGPRRTTGTGPRFLSKDTRRRSGSDSGDDVPLSVAASRALKLPQRASDSDDERPLSSLLQKKQPGLLDVNFDNLLSPNKGGDDEDDQPLGLRVSRLAPSLHANSQAGDDDDDRPLALHPEQQRRSQLHMMAQQQQQFVMQAQMQNSMYFSPPSMMGTPFFGPAMMPMMVQPPMPIPSPPPMHDQAKFNRVDSWRRGVAVEDGE